MVISLKTTYFGEILFLFQFITCIKRRAIYYSLHLFCTRKSGHLSKKRTAFLNIFDCTIVDCCCVSVFGVDFSKPAFHPFLPSSDGRQEKRLSRLHDNRECHDVFLGLMKSGLAANFIGWFSSIYSIYVNRYFIGRLSASINISQLFVGLITSHINGIYDNVILYTEWHTKHVPIFSEASTSDK